MDIDEKMEVIFESLPVEIQDDPEFGFWFFWGGQPKAIAAKIKDGEPEDMAKEFISQAKGFIDKNIIEKYSLP